MWIFSVRYVSFVVRLCQKRSFRWFPILGVGPTARNLCRKFFTQWWIIVSTRSYCIPLYFSVCRFLFLFFILLMHGSHFVYCYYKQCAKYSWSKRALLFNWNELLPSSQQLIVGNEQWQIIHNGDNSCTVQSIYE